MLSVSRWWFPEPLPVLGPPDSARIAARAADYLRTVGAPPDDDTLADFASLELRDELLFREALKREWYQQDPLITARIIQNVQFLDPGAALTTEAATTRGLALNMHLTDEVIRRRLVQRMEQELLLHADLPAIEATALRAAYDERAASLVSPATLSFSHVFLGDVDPKDARAVLASIRDTERSVSDARTMGKPFLGGYVFQHQTWQQVSSRFGNAFADVLAEQVVALSGDSGWLEPAASPFGWHLVYVHGFQPELPQTYDEVVDTLLWQLQQEQQQTALNDAISTLMDGYQVRTW
jgi:hypothetical protein